MLREIFRFELRQQLRQGLFVVSLGFFFVLTFVIVTSEGAQIGGAGGSVFKNSPFVVVQLLASMGLVGLFLTTAFVANATVRDVETGAAPLFFTTGLRKGAYFFGRFSGAFLAAVLTSSAAVLAMILGSFMPWLDPATVGPFQLWPYIYAMLVLVIPNLYITGAIFFSLASITRSLLATYVGLVATFVAWAVSQNLLGDLENNSLAAMLDPFGLAAVDQATRFWTVFDKNNLTPELGGALLSNRLLWMGLATAVLLLTYRFYRFESGVSRQSRRGRKNAAQLQARSAAPVGSLALPKVERSFGWAQRLEQLLRQTRMECRLVFRSVGFTAILLFGVMNLVGGSLNLGALFGTNVLPVTAVMLQAIGGAFLFLLIIILTVYSGEMAWRERAMKLDGVYGALPVPNGVLVGSKLLALAGISVAVLLVGALTAMAVQTFLGFHDYQPWLYFKGLFLWQLPGFLLVAVLALFLQVLAPNKFVGYLLMVGYLLSGMLYGALRLEHHLYQYGSLPGGPYSDLNGFGHFVQPRFWVLLYWSFLAAILATAAVALWRRGAEDGLALRWRLARQHLQGGRKWLLATVLVGFLATGGYVLYNTNVLNDYVPSSLVEQQQAEYERRYRQHLEKALPKITSVYAEVDLEPERRHMVLRGHYLLENRSLEPIDEVHLTLNAGLEVRRMELPGASPELEDNELGYRIYRLQQAMEPGGNSRLDFELAFEPRGFVNHNPVNQIVANGTFFSSLGFFPTIGYQEAAELQDPGARRRQELPPPRRLPPIDDPRARQRNFINADADWVQFEAVISTAPDQIAVAPGYLQREWMEDGRRHFHYKMDKPILKFFSFLSARYQVRRDQWQDVAIEIFHHPDHHYNVDRMVEAVKHSLDYYSKAFSPYQHRQVRILEFPRYAGFAQAFANTIPYSEGLGFIADLDSEDDLDYVYYVTAHEVAHQWWAHQVIPARSQGGTLIIESLAQYSALMVMEKQYGRDKMRRFLRYELDRYLRGRGGEGIEELPLRLVENQAYIHYNKGSLAFYALRDAIGEEALNRALANLVRNFAFQGPPYATTDDVLAEIRAVTPPEYQALVDDLFEHITLFDNKVESAVATRLPDGRYQVDLELTARKLRADGEGKESEVPVDDWVDVGVFAQDENGEERVLYMEKHHIRDARTRLDLVLEERPREVGVDPFNKLVDRNPENNRQRVEGAAE